MSWHGARRSPWRYLRLGACTGAIFACALALSRANVLPRTRNVPLWAHTRTSPRSRHRARLRDRSIWASIRLEASKATEGWHAEGDSAMPMYVTLIRYTEQGVKTFKDLPRRLEETRKVGEPLGAKLVSFYLTMGQYDAVIMSEAPDDETVAKLALATGGRGTSAPRRCVPLQRTKPRGSPRTFPHSHLTSIGRATTPIAERACIITSLPNVHASRSGRGRASTRSRRAPTDSKARSILRCLPEAVSTAVAAAREGVVARRLA